MRGRVRFSKYGKIRFVSHRDLARVWERALRRAELPVAMTEGFTPRPKLHFGLALGTGYESAGEYLDIDFTRAVDLALLPEVLGAALPAGVTVQAAEVLEPGTPSLQQAVTSCTWRLEVAGAEPEEIRASIQRVLAATSLPVTRTRKGKAVHDDIRPLLLELRVTTADSHRVEFVAELGTQPRALRPSEVVDVLDPALELVRAERLHQWTTPDGAPREPIPLRMKRALLAEAGTS